jgi:hypothetical protein
VKPKSQWNGKSVEELTALGSDKLLAAAAELADMILRIDTDLGASHVGRFWPDGVAMSPLDLASWRHRANTAKRFLAADLAKVKDAIRLVNVRNDPLCQVAKPEGVRQAFPILCDLLEALDGYNFDRDPQTAAAISEGLALRDWRNELKGGEA